MFIKMYAKFTINTSNKIVFVDIYSKFILNCVYVKMFRYGEKIKFECALLSPWIRA